MSRYIDADALYKVVTEKYYDITAGCYPYNIVAYDMAQLVKNAPTADVVEVVRCKDCRHWNNEGYDSILESAFGECRKSFEDYHCCETTEGDYCSYGERREG